MPRDGSGVYSRPPGTDAVADTTIDSAKYNNNVQDVEADLNTPRPVVAGGTGASSAAQALINLGVAGMAVRYDAAQTLTQPQLIQARQNIYAAPFDAMAHNGMQINGSFEVAQEKTAGSLITVNGAYFCDNWQFFKTGAAVAAAQVGPGSFFPGYVFGGAITVSTAQASMLAGDAVAIYQSIEGWRIARLAWGSANAQSITIGFWSAHHRTGLYTGTIRSGNVARSYGFSYTHNVADVAQFNTITIPGDTTGTWTTDQTAGMVITLTMACGTTFTAPSVNSWQAGNFIAAPGQVNGVASTLDIFRITGLIVLPGIEAPNAARAPLIMRPYDHELLWCQRYFCSDFPAGTSPANNIQKNSSIGACYSAGSLVGNRISLARPMRVLPTVTTFSANATVGTPTPNLWQIFIAGAWANTNGTAAVGVIGMDGFTMGVGHASAVAGSSYMIAGSWFADARL